MIETLAMLGSTISLIVPDAAQRPLARGRAQPRAGSPAQPPPPLVDVFICTYNEERGDPRAHHHRRAVAWTTPASASGCSTTAAAPWLRDLCRRSSAPTISRAPTTPTPRPATSTTACCTWRACEQPPDFIAILDADFVPMPHFLDRTLPPVPRGRRRHRADAAALHQSRPAAEQPVDRRASGPTSSATSSTW